MVTSKILPYFSDDWPLLFSSEEHTAANTTNAANLLFFYEVLELQNYRNVSRLLRIFTPESQAGILPKTKMSPHLKSKFSIRMMILAAIVLVSLTQILKQILRGLLYATGLKTIAK